jgi:hypothetical protein
VDVSLSDFADSTAGFGSSVDVSFLAADELVSFLLDAELLSTISSFGGIYITIIVCFTVVLAPN